MSGPLRVWLKLRIHQGPAVNEEELPLGNMRRSFHSVCYSDLTFRVALRAVNRPSRVGW